MSTDTPESVRAERLRIARLSNFYYDIDLDETFEVLERYAELLKYLSAPVPLSEWEAMVSERDALKARVEELESALRMILIQDQFLHRDPTGESTYYYNSFDIDVIVNDALTGEEG